MTSAHPHVVVLGAGIAGLSIAWRLLRKGARVEVVAGAEPPASLVAAGMLAPMPEGDINPAIGGLAAEGLRSYPRFLAELAEDTKLPTGFQRSGLLRVAYTEAEALAIRDQVGAYEAAGMPSRWLSPKACRAEAPGLGEAGLQGGLLSYEEAQVQPDWILGALREAVARLGGSLRDGEAREVTPGTECAVVSVASAAGMQALPADLVVVAMGSWSGALPGAAMPIRPVKGQLLTLTGRPGPARILYWGHNYLLTKPDGTVVLGATMEDAGFSIDVDSRGEALRAVLDQLWPELATAPATGMAGLRPAAADRIPVIGWLTPGSVYAFTAHFRNGFLLAPLTAELAANEIVEGAVEGSLLRLRPGRLGATQRVSS